MLHSQIIFDSRMSPHLLSAAGKAAGATAVVPAATALQVTHLRHSVAAQSAITVVDTTSTSLGGAYAHLAGLCGASGPVAVGKTDWGGRGLVLQQDMPARQAMLEVPLFNALTIADDPISGISIFSDRQHRRWQELHGGLPPLLLEFLQGDARWDARMAAWLLWLMQHPSPLWRTYLDQLPAESDMTCLLNFSQAEIEELQVPSLKGEAAHQAAWCAHLHAKYFSAASGSLAPLRLSSSLPHSLWAISLVRSRTFSEDVNGEALTLMVPCCDMANHCSNHNSTFCISHDFKRPLSCGEELTISYGAEKPNCEALRDYGFVLAGNSHDRIQFGIKPDAGAAAAAAGAAGGSVSGGPAVPGLNEACLMEAAGFTGDLAAGNIQPATAQQQSKETLQQQQQALARREAALLSMPLKDANSASDTGGIFGWLSAASQPWTDSGKPPPQPLQKHQAAAERAAVHSLQQQLHQQLAVLPTSLQTDQELLAQLELHMAADSTLGPGSALQQGRGSSSGSSSSVQQRRQARLQQQSNTAQLQLPSAALSAAGGDRSPSLARVSAAVRARLEHKLLLQEGLSVLQQYDQYLRDRFGSA